MKYVIKLKREDNTMQVKRITREFVLQHVGRRGPRGPDGANGNVFLDVRDFGAKIDGATEDTVAIQNAINTAYTRGGGIVFLPQGTALVSTIDVLRHVTIVGTGKRSSVLKLKDGVNAPVVTMHQSEDGIEPNAQFCMLADFGIDGNKANNTSTDAHGIEAVANPLYSKATEDEWFDPHNYFRNLMIINCGGKGVYSNGRSEMRLDNVFVEKCNAGGIDTAFDTFLVNCSVSNNDGFGFRFNNGNIMASNCKAFLTGRIGGTDDPGFYITGDAVSIVLTSCIAQNNNGPGFRIVNATAVSMSGCAADSNNYGDGNAADAAAGVELDNVQNSIIGFTATQGYQNGSLVGNQAYALRLVNGSDANNINVTTDPQDPFVMLGTLTPDSIVRMNLMVENGRITNSGDAMTISRYGVSSQNGGRLRFIKWGNNVSPTGGMLNGTELGGIDYFGYELTENTTGSAQAKLSVAASQIWTPTAKGTSLTFQHTRNNTTGLTNAWRVDGTGQVIFYGAVIPTADITYNFGTPSFQWLNAYFRKVFLNSTATIDGASPGVLQVVGDLRITAAGTNSASVPTLSSTNTLTNKTFNGIRFASVTKTANYTATTSDHTIRFDATSGNLTCPLPAAAACVGLVLVMKKIDGSANTVTIDANGTETIDGALTLVIASQYTSFTIQSNGTGWDII